MTKKSTQPPRSQPYTQLPWAQSYPYQLKKIDDTTRRKNTPVDMRFYCQPYAIPYDRPHVPTDPKDRPLTKYDRRQQRRMDSAWWRVRRLQRHGSRRIKVIIKRSMGLIPQEILLRVKYQHLDPAIRNMLLNLIDTRSMTAQDIKLTALNSALWSNSHTFILSDTQLATLGKIQSSNDLDERWMLAHELLGTPEHLHKAKVLKRWLLKKLGRRPTNTDFNEE